MYEVELKVEAEHEVVRECLDQQGAERLGTVVQEDIYYNAPHRDFVETDEALRLRRERNAAETDWETAITYKGPLLDDKSKSREEFETMVGDGETADEILTRLGFDPATTVRKEREQYDLAGVTITLDDVDGLGQYVEAELEAETEAIDPVRTQAAAALESIGLDPDNQIRTSYLGLLLGESAK